MDIGDLPGLEAAMWETETRGDRDWMDAHLAPDFTEFGRSGRSYGRDDILDVPVGDIDATLSELVVRPVGADIALVTYRSVSGGQHAHRSSIWRHSATGWLLEFHQGTPTTP